MSDSFSMNVFKDSFRKIFEADATGYLQHAYNAKLEVLCSKELKVTKIKFHIIDKWLRHVN